MRFSAWQVYRLLPSTASEHACLLYLGPPLSSSIVAPPFTRLAPPLNTTCMPLPFFVRTTCLTLPDQESLGREVLQFWYKDHVTV